MNTIKESDQTFFTSMILVLQNTFGTRDLEWFSVAETVLNTLFNMKSDMTYEWVNLLVN